MPFSSTIQNIQLPLLNNVIQKSIFIFDYILCAIIVIINLLLISCSWLIYLLGNALFYVWDNTMQFNGRKDVIVDNNDTRKCYYRYSICFNESSNTPFNIYIHHYISSEKDYYSDEWNSVSIVLFGSCNKRTIDDKDKKTIVRTVGSIHKKPARIATKTILKPNTTCWELLVVGKKMNKSQMIPETDNDTNWIDVSNSKKEK